MTLPASCFYWERQRGGLARHDGVQIELRVMPPVVGLPEHIVEIDFIVDKHRGDLRISAGGRREMTRGECDAVQVWLHRVCADARQLI